MCLQVPRKKLEIESLPTGEEQGLCVGASFKIAVSTFAVISWLCLLHSNDFEATVSV